MKNKTSLPPNIDAIIRERLSSFEPRPCKSTELNHSAIFEKIEAQRAINTAKQKRRNAIAIAASVAGGLLGFISLFSILGYFYPNFLVSLRTEAVDFSVFKKSIETITYSTTTLYAIPFAILLTFDALIRQHKKKSSKRNI